MKWLYLVCVLALVLVVIIITYAGGEIIPSLRDVIEKRPGQDVGEDESTTQEDELQKRIDVYYFDIGGGDSALYVCGGQTMLVDCGEKDYSGRIVGNLEHLGIKKIDYLVATSLEYDTIGGMTTIIQKFDIGKVITPSADTVDLSNPLYLGVLSAMNAKEMEHPEKILPENGYEFRLGSAFVEVLCTLPEGEIAGDVQQELCLHISLDDMSFLHLGNVSGSTLDNLMMLYPDMYASVIKMPNHGKYTLELEEFIPYCASNAAVIDVGYSYRGMPTDKTLEALETSQVKTYRTDENGTIQFTSDGKTFTIKTDK